MSELALISKVDFEGEIPLSSNIVFDKKMQPYVLNAQDFDLKQRLGNSFYHALISNANDPIYQTLLNGATYTNYNSDVISFKGIKKAIAHYAYARYVLESNTDSTAFGMRQKTTDVSEAVSDKKLAEISNSHFNMAESIMNDVVHYLNDTTIIATYPIWKKANLLENRGSRPKIFTVSRV